MKILILYPILLALAFFITSCEMPEPPPKNPTEAMLDTYQMPPHHRVTSVMVSSSYYVIISVRDDMPGRTYVWRMGLETCQAGAMVLVDGEKAGR